jgi:hypothetical protein
VNSEAKVRRSMRLIVLKKAKVMSYEDLEEVWPKRTAKEKTSTAKGQGKGKSYVRTGTKGRPQY